MAHTENVFKTIFHGIPDPITIVRRCDDGAFRFEMGNRTAYECGFFEESFVGQTAHQLFPPDIASSVEAYFRDAADTRGTVVFTGHIATKKGMFLGELSYIPIFEGDVCTKLIVIAKDITEKKLRERQLEESEQRYKSLFDHNPDAVFSIDREGRFVSANRRASEITGLDKDKLIGTVFARLAHPDDVPIAYERFHAVLSGEVGDIQIRVASDMVESGYMTMKITTMPVYVDGVIVGMFGIAKDVTEMLKAQRELEESEQRYKSLFEHNPDGVYTLDMEGRFVHFNQVLPGILGFPAAELPGKSFVPFVHPDDLSATMEHYGAALSGEVREYEVRARNRRFPAQDKYFAIKNIPIYINGEIQGVFGIAKNITAWKKTQKDLIDSEERHRRLIELSPDPIVVYGKHRMLYWNRAATICFRNAGEDAFADCLVQDLIPASDSRSTGLVERINDASEILEAEEVVLKRLDGTTFHAEVVGTRLEYDGHPASLLIVRDISKRKKSEQMVEYLAYHDALTGLPNRVRFYRLVEDSLASPCGALFFIDLDRFKLVNDTLGHRAGDLLLNEVSRRLQSVENGLFSRQGGDEFTAYFPGADRAEAKRTAYALLALLAEPYVVDGHELYVTPSIGISLYPGDSAEVETLIQQADAALYEAKESGGNTYMFFSADTEKRNAWKLSLGNELRKALANGDLFLNYQAKYDIRAMRIVGVEALVRWKHREQGIIPPDRFIPFAEETGLIMQIGDWVLRAACAQAKTWLDAGYAIPVSVNVSVRQFLQRTFVEQIDAALLDTGLDPNYLNLEITESVPLSDLQSVIEKLNRVKALGVTISLDDFGTGYSSLNYIRQLPFDFVKIDKSFIQNMHQDAFHLSIVRSVVSIAHLLGKKVVAEGVETLEHLELLIQSGCDEAQGYHLSRPLDTDAFERLLFSANNL